MSLGLVAAMRLIPQDGALSLAALCLGGLALYALARLGHRRRDPRRLGCSHEKA